MQTRVIFHGDNWDEDAPYVATLPDGRWVIGYESEEIDATTAREIAECLNAAANECDRRNGVKRWVRTAR